MSLKVGPAVGHVDCIVRYGRVEWKRTQALPVQPKQGRTFQFTININNTTVKCLLSANSLLSPSPDLSATSVFFVFFFKTTTLKSREQHKLSG